ncbi:hypothetical protein ACLPHD_06330 [Serratia odorifera]|uniref:hypothetical protein n=1 Tax=Serratia odorifera TaxID=618 RepID=UPI003D2E110A
MRVVDSIISWYEARNGVVSEVSLPVSQCMVRYYEGRFVVFVGGESHKPTGIMITHIMVEDHEFGS